MAKAKRKCSKIEATGKFSWTDDGEVIPLPTMGEENRLNALLDEAETMRNSLYEIEEAVREIENAPRKHFSTARWENIDRLLSQIDGAVVEMADELDTIVESSNSGEDTAMLLNELDAMAKPKAKRRPKAGRVVRSARKS